MQYRTKEQALQLINQLKTEHNCGHYTVRFTERNKKKYSVANCNWAIKQFSFVEFYVLHMTDDDFREVILHEIAHALTPGHGHDIYFKRVCLQIGGKPSATGYYSYLEDKRPEHLQKKINYIYECKTCNHQMKTTKKLKRRYSCPNCDPKHFNENFILELVQSKKDTRLLGFSLS